MIKSISWKIIEEQCYQEIINFWLTEWFEIKNEDNITLHEFIIGLYKIKSHKFDQFHEYYIGIQQFEPNEIDYNRDEILSDIFLGLKFDKNK